MLGPLEVTADGRSLELAGVRSRAVLAMLLMHANQVVSSDRLLEDLWPGQPADKATGSLQVRLSELRKAFRYFGTVPAARAEARAAGGAAPRRAGVAGRGAAGLRQAPGPHRGAGDAHRGPSAP